MTTYNVQKCISRIIWNTCNKFEFIAFFNLKQLHSRTTSFRHFQRNIFVYRDDFDWNASSFFVGTSYMVAQRKRYPQSFSSANHYIRKKESDERKRIQRHDFSGSSRKSSMVSFSFHSFTLVCIRVHSSNERTIPILVFRIHRVPSSAYIRFTSKRIHSFGEKENEMIE